MEKTTKQEPVRFEVNSKASAMMFAVKKAMYRENGKPYVDFTLAEKIYKSFTDNMNLPDFTSANSRTYAIGSPFGPDSVKYETDNQ